MKIRSAIYAMLVLGLFAASAPAQKLYKWVDEDGNIHYSDKVPPEHVKQAREELNEQGIVVDRVDRAKTPEEIAAEEEARRKAEEEERRLAKQREEDRKLLAIYATEDDIIRARDQQLDAINRAIDASRAFVNGQSKSLAKLMERAAQAQDRGEQVTEALQSSISRAQNEIREQEEYIAEKEAEKVEVIEHFDTELARFREIRRRHSSPDEAAEEPGQKTAAQSLEESSG